MLLRPFFRWIVREPEIIVRTPPIDAELAAAITLIAPYFPSIPPDRRQGEYEREQNGSCWVEDAALGPLLTTMPPPRRVLDIGAGLGRAAVFFSRRYFPEAHFDLFDATGHDTKYDLMGDRNKDSFCGNLAMLRRCLEFNDVRNFSIIDADTTGGHIDVHSKKFDFIYSFYSVGYHWSIDHWLDEILAVCHDGTLCAFSVPSQYEPSPRVASLPHMLLEATSLRNPNPGSTGYFLVFTPKPTSWLPA